MQTQRQLVEDLLDVSRLIAGKLRLEVGSVDFLPHVFDRFRQADATTTRKHGGLALGLAIVRHLIELHNGSVDTSSAGLGAGSTFTVRLPVLQEQEAVKAPIYSLTRLAQTS